MRHCHYQDDPDTCTELCEDDEEVVPPTPETQEKLLEKFYGEVRITPHSSVYFALVHTDRLVLGPFGTSDEATIRHQALAFPDEWKIVPMWQG